jgi:tetratricopeptide (TPR) repeat protein
MKDVLRAAMTAHQAGQLAQAAQLYQNVLAQEQENAEALHMLGVVHHQQGDNTGAIELMGRAVVLRPNNPVFHANLAEAYRANGQYERAAGCCRTAISLRPNYPEAIANLGLALQGMGLRDEACRWRRFPIVRKLSGTSRPSPAYTTTWATFSARSSVTPRPGPHTSRRSAWHPTSPRLMLTWV